MSLRYDTCVLEKGLNILNVSFTGCETIELDLTDIFKDLGNFETLYEPINEYVATLSIDDQKSIYDTFFELYVSDEKNNFDDPLVINTIEFKIKTVVDLFDYNRFKAWVRGESSKIIYPDNIISDYVHDPDGNTTIEKTYVKREYTDLISLIMAIRAVLPLYINFYNLIKQVTKQHSYRLFMLFVKSDIAACEEIVKLRVYIDVNQQTLIGPSKNENLILFTGLATDDILDALLSEVVFNKLLTIDFFHKKCNIVSFIFNTIKFKGKFSSSNGENIRGKSIENNPNKEDISYFEDYRKTSDVPVGTVVEIQNSLSDVRYLVQAIGEQNFNYPLYEQEIALIGRHLTYKMDKTQVYLLGWFMNKVINPRALYYIEYRKLVELMLFAKVVLLSHGFNYVAMVLSAKKSQDEGYLSAVIKNSMNKVSVKKLSSSYSYSMEEDKQSVIEKTILELSKEVSNTSWQAIGSAEQFKKVGVTSGFLDTPSNINDMMLEFVEFVNT